VPAEACGARDCYKSAAKAVLIAKPAQIIDALKSKVEAAGFEEVILYFNLGRKPHAQVKAGNGARHARDGTSLRRHP
jgi:hypothetical protein